MSADRGTTAGTAVGSVWNPGKVRGLIQHSILIVDDEQAVRYTLRRLLEGSGHRIVEAGSAEEALELAGQGSLDLVITDLKMPGGDGLSLAKTLLSQDPSRPVMLMTGYADVDSARSALQLGVYEYFTKPMDTNEVLVRVSRALERRKLVLDSIAHNREVERRLQERTAELDRAHAERLQADRLATVGRLASVVGHDVMSPLSVVAGRIDMVLMRGVADETDRASLESASRSLDQVVNMLKELRTYGNGRAEGRLSESLSRKLGELVSDGPSGQKGGSAR
jgi:CheY-like chemotaxis protein